MSPEERLRLNEELHKVEAMVLETKRVRVETEDGTVLWKTVVKGDASIYDIEMAMESNPDYYSFFEKEDGSIVTKFDIERQLDKTRKWIYEIVRERSQNRRFSRM